MIRRSGSRVLRGYVHLPRNGAPSRSTCVVAAYPFEEERKRAYRALVETAVILQNAGFPVIRADYAGTGESDGDFTEVKPSGMLEDLGSVADHALGMEGVRGIGLLGLRFGANLALRLAVNGLPVEFIVMWEPVIDVRDYINRRLGASNVKILEGTGSVNLKGYEYSRDLYRECIAVPPLREIDVPDVPILVTTLGGERYAHRGNQWSDIKSCWRSRGFDNVTWSGSITRPFWEELVLPKCEENMKVTLDWITGLASGSEG